MNEKEIAKKHVLESIGKDDNWKLYEDISGCEVYCVDGRTTHPIYGALAGSAGIFARETISFIDLAEDKDVAFKVKDSLFDLLNLFRTKYNICLHSDDHSEAPKLGCGYFNLDKTKPDQFGIRLPERRGNAQTQGFSFIRR